MDDFTSSEKHKLKEDRFLEAIFHFRKKMAHYKKPLSYAGIGLLLAVGIIVAFTQYNKKNNEEANTYFGTANLQIQQGQYTEAIGTLKRILDNYSGSSSAPKALYLTGSVHYTLGNYQLAVESFKKFVEKYDGSEFLNTAVYKGLGASYMQLKDYKQAIEAFKTAIGDYPEDFQIPDIRFKMALCYLELKETEKAKQELSTIVKDAPKTPFTQQAGLLLASL